MGKRRSNGACLFLGRFGPSVKVNAQLSFLRLLRQRARLVPANMRTIRSSVGGTTGSRVFRDGFFAGDRGLESVRLKRQNEQGIACQQLEYPEAALRTERGEGAGSGCGLGSGRQPFVAMVEPADLGEGNDLAWTRRLRSTRFGAILTE